MRRVSLCATGTVAATLLTTVGTAASHAASTAAWTSYDRPAQYAVAVDQHVPVQMSDGVVLNAVVRRPDAPGRFPVMKFWTDDGASVRATVASMRS